jgi:hypothetical protein
LKPWYTAADEESEPARASRVEERIVVDRFRCKLNNGNVNDSREEEEGVQKEDLKRISSGLGKI